MFKERFAGKKLEEVGCPTCGIKSKKRLLHFYEGIGFYCCNSCNINFASPRLIEKELLRLYEGSEWRNFNDFLSWNYHDWINSQDPSYFISKLNLELIKKFLKQGSRILDVGCDIGLDVRFLKENGYLSKGVEVSTIGSRIANEIVGAEVYNTELKNYKPQEKFHGVMLMDVLEHLYDPIAVLNDINDRLIDHGYLFIHVPHHNGISARWKKIMHRIGLKKSFKHFGFPAHLYGFDKKSLKKMLHQSNFEAVFFESWPRKLTTGKVNFLNAPFVYFFRRFALSDYILCVAIKRN